MFLNVHALDKNSIVWFLFGLMLRGVTKNTFIRMMIRCESSLFWLCVEVHTIHIELLISVGLLI